MTKPPNDVGASVRARLLRLARERGEDFQLLLTRHAPCAAALGMRGWRTEGRSLGRLPEVTVWERTWGRRDAKRPFQPPSTPKASGQCRLRQRATSFRRRNAAAFLNKEGFINPAGSDGGCVSVPKLRRPNPGNTGRAAGKLQQVTH